MSDLTLNTVERAIAQMRIAALILAESGNPLMARLLAEAANELEADTKRVAK